MAALNKDELLKLSPAERIAHLKKLEEEKKKELEEAEKLLKETEKEISDAVSDAKKERALEEMIGGRHRQVGRVDDEEQAPEHREETHPVHVDYRPKVDYAIDLYQRIKTYADREEPLNNAERASVEAIYGTFNDVIREASEHEEKIEHISSSVKRLVKDLLGEYHSNLKYDSE